jgi:hypothetical protein
VKLLTRLTLAYGLLYLALGIIGFIPALTHSTSHAGQGMLLGLFAVNGPHSILHLVFGAILVWGGLAEENVIPATRTMTVVFAAILLAGFVPLIADPLQLDWSDVAPHLGSAIVAGGLWWAATRARSMQQRRAT